MQIVNVTDPAHPTRVSGIFDGQDGFDALFGPAGVDTVSISGRIYAVVASYGSNAVQVIDVTDPKHLVPTSAIYDDKNGFDALHRPIDVATATISGRTYAVVIGSYHDMQVIDITDPAHPVPVGIFSGWDVSDTSSRLTSIATTSMSGHTYAVITGYRNSAVQVIDITDPMHPVRTGSIFDGKNGLSFDAPSSVDLTIISGRTYAIMTTHAGDGIQIADITDTASLTLTHEGKGKFDWIEWPSAAAVTTVSGRHYAMVTNYLDDAVQVVEITEPIHPRPTSTIFYRWINSTGERPVDIATATISGRQYAIVASYGNDAVRVFDITDPILPRLTSSVFDGKNGFDALGWPSGVSMTAIRGNTYAVVTSIDDRIQIINMTDPAHPTPTGSIFGGRNGFDTIHRPIDVATTTISDRTYAVVVGEGGSNTQIIDITDPAHPALTSSIFGDQNRTGVTNRPAGVAITTLSDSVYAIMTDYDDSAVWIINITDPAYPVLAGSIFDGGNAVDASHKPIDVAAITIYGRTYVVVIDHDYVGGRVFDITDPAHPLPSSILGGKDFDTLYDATNVAKYSIFGSQLPKGFLRFSEGTTGITTHTMSGNVYAIMTNYAGAGTQIINITDTTWPAPVTTIPDGQYDAYLDWPDGIATYAVSGHHYAAMIDDYDGVNIVNITGPRTSKFD